VIPQLRDWHGKYASAGLTIVGVHSPEFFWEKPTTGVAAATKKLGILYPVVQDNDFATWKRFGVWAWPTAVLIDKKGVLRDQNGREDLAEKVEKMLAE